MDEHHHGRCGGTCAGGSLGADETFLAARADLVGISGDRIIDSVDPAERVMLRARIEVAEALREARDEQQAQRVAELVLMAQAGGYAQAMNDMTAAMGG